MRSRLASQPRLPHLIIEAVQPDLDCGRSPVKRIAGENCIVSADIFRDGSAAIAAVIKWRPINAESLAEAPMTYLDNDRWRGEFPLETNTRYFFMIEAWTRAFVSWRDYFVKKAATKLEVGSNLAEGIALLDEICDRAYGPDRDLIAFYNQRIRKLTDPTLAAKIVVEKELEIAIARHEERADAVTFGETPIIVADRPRARFGAWYEMFARSSGSRPARQGSLREAETRLADIRDMGFDIVYLTPIHPIGLTCRKGRDNSLIANPGDPGSPWAIGSPAGGHTAIEPTLGTLEDFDHFVATARHLDLEVALDFAIQCSPDHPWVAQHPQWFEHRPDGSIKYAENPPKQYQDIYPVNFDTSDQAGLMEELRRIVFFWIGHGVRIFRVDNPHTKPIAFWRWLINGVQDEYPEVIFLAEAFTRPKLMKALAKAGFTQSYTYFTWRNTKAELTEYMTELTQDATADYFRPNFFVNTPDILPPILQNGGRAAFKSRLVLAATLAPAYGIYSGYELCENEAVPGTEEYANSEKYEIKYRDWDSAGNLREFIARVNTIRRSNPALHQLTNLRFLSTDNDQILFYVKSCQRSANVILVAVNLDPHNIQIGTGFVPPEVIGGAADARYQVTDLLTGASYDWGSSNYIRLDPQVEPAHILRVDRRA